MTGQQINSSYIGIETFNGLAPKRGPRVLGVSLDFSIQGSYVVDMTQAQQLDRIEFIQGMYVDNSANSAPLVFTIRHINFSLQIPPYSQGYVPIPASNPPKIGVSTTTTGVINIDFFTFPVPAEIWQVSSLPTAGGLGTDNSANKPTLLSNLIATAPVNAARSLLGYQNQSANVHQLVMDDGTGNNETILLMPAGYSAGTAGASYIDVAFKGRARVYSSASGDQCALYQR